MDADALAALNAQCGLPDHLTFGAGPGGLPVAEIANAHATARVALQGAQVLAFRPHGAAPVIWVSAASHYTPGKAIRGGIPICWPWFGPHPTDATKPQHGFVRTLPWTVQGSGVAADGATELRLGLTDTEATRALWPHAFALELLVSVGAALTVTLTAHNPGPDPYTMGAALHSYFAVADSATIAIHGLEDTDYFDKVAGAPQHQDGPVRLTGETDRVYGDTTAPCIIDDPGLGRRLRIDKTGSRSTVVWNPWANGAQRMADFGADEYRHMVCVETANAGPDVVTVAPQGRHVLQTIISVEAGDSTAAP